MNKLTVDFVVAHADSRSMTAQENSRMIHALSGAPAGKCYCGAESFVLANEMKADTAKGIPASRMYECTACGTYRLG